MCDWICQVRTVCMRVRDSLEWCIVNTQREVRIKKNKHPRCVLWTVFNSCLRLTVVYYYVIV